ncbi:MAG: hypothetical protein B0D85_02885, partial [Candidatus Sedimenticola endophacoides]
MSLSEADIARYRSQLSCNFGQLDDLFADCMEEAALLLSEQGTKDYLEGASQICRIGRGFEPVLVYLEEMPFVAHKLGEETLAYVSRTIWTITRTPNGRSIPDFMQTLPEAARRLLSREQFEHYVDLVMDMMARTSTSIHGNQSDTFPSPGMPALLKNTPYLLHQLSLEGLRNWVDYGVLHYNNHPERQIDYFSLQSADSRAVLQRERHGTLYADHERKLDLYTKALWQTKVQFVPYSEGWDELRKPMPYYDPLGMRIPDVYDDRNGIRGIDRYRAAVAHMSAHQRWTSQIVADNFSPFQRVAAELLEDSRVEYLAMREYPGLRRIWLTLHPKPGEADCDPQRQSCIRHRLAMLSYAIPDELPETVAAVDLGSNSFHMIVARISDGNFQVVDKLREMVRLGGGLDKERNLTPEAQERALACLERFGQRVSTLPPGSVRAVGTNTLRQVRRSSDFIKRAEQALGHPIEVIAGREEARLVYLGVAHGFATDNERRLVVDIGGGSTELIIGDGFTPRNRESLNMGCVSASRRHFPDGVISEQTMKQAELRGALEIRPVKSEYRDAGWQLAVGSSGTIRAIRTVIQECGWAAPGEGITDKALKRLR